MKQRLYFNRVYFALFMLFLISISSYAQIDSILIDFGDDLSASPWNNITNPDTGFVDNLLNQRNELSTISIKITDDFNHINNSGTKTPSPSLGIPPTASGDSFYGNVAEFNSQEQPTAALEISNLDPNKAYTFSIFASRTATDNREAEYIVNGFSSDTLYLDAASNDSIVAVVTSMPDSNGKIQLEVGPGPNNSNGSNFYYLGALIISYESPPVVVALDSVMIDFGSDLSASPWNNITNPDTGFVDNLLNQRNEMSAISIRITDDFNHINTAGTKAPASSLGMPPTATGDSFYGNVAEFNSQEQPTAALEVTNLDQNKAYTFSIFASRSASDNREAEYIVNGISSDTLYLDAASNDSIVAVVTSMPNADGEIQILVGPGPNNTNGSNFYYLGAIIISYEYTPIVVTAGLDSILVDFGDNLSPAPWNNITNPDTGFVDNLLNQRNEFSTIAIKVTDDFNNINRAGTETPSPGIGFPPTASGDSFFGNVADFGGQLQPTGGLEVSNLNPNTAYTFSIFASRVATDNREAEYILNGITSDTVYLDASSNDSNVAVVKSMPDADGKIQILVGPGPNNTNSSNFYYLGAIIISYEYTPVASGLDTILVDFGDTPSPAPWNNISNAKTGSIDDLALTSGFSSERSIAIFDDFNGINTAGTTIPDPSIGIPVTASGDSFFGNVTEFSGQFQPTAGIRLSNFDILKPVEINIFASRNASDNRETQYIVEGATSDTLLLDAASNTDKLVKATVLPKEDGTIDILVSTGPNNSNGSGFYYFGALKVIYEAGEVAGSELSLISPNGGESWQVGKIPRITWQNKNNPIVLAEYSTDNGTTWSEAGSAAGVSGGLEWEVPNEVTEEALVRISAGENTDISERVFTITDDSTICNIVILGSSTAEGAGSSPRDSSWVNRFSRHLSQMNTKFNVINLGKGGYNTFHILPDGSEIPDGVTTNIDEERNMTKALSYNPSTIIVNMPSNDASSGFGVEMQLANFKTLFDAGQAQGANTFICTTQPRNFSDEAKLEIQAVVADSILSIYGDNAIDFWSVLVATDTTILDELDSGDGVHVNNTGHFALFKQVVNKQIDTSACSNIVSIYDLPNTDISSINVFPNPFDNELSVNFNAKEVGTATIVLFDNLGRKIEQSEHQLLHNGDQTITLKNIDKLSSSLSIVHLQVILDSKNGKSSKVVSLVKQR